MTKKEMFTEIITVATTAGRNDIVEFAQKEIDLLNKRSSKESKAQKAKVEENAKLAEAIVQVVTETTNPMRAMDIATAVGISPQKATPILKALVANNRLAVDTLKRGVKVYGLTN